MKKKIRRRMSGAMAVALLFTAMPSKAMAGSGSANSNDVIEQESEILSEDAASISDDLENIDVSDMSEENTTLRGDAEFIANDLENADVSDI